MVAVAALEFSYVTAAPDLWGHIYFGADQWKSDALKHTDLYYLNFRDSDREAKFVYLSDFMEK